MPHSPPASPTPPSALERPAAVPPASWRRPLRLAVLVPLVLYAIARLRDARWWDLLDDLNLAVHEAGHIVFSPFGDQLAALGGSLFQLLVPIAFVVYFWRTRQRWAAGVTVAWVAVNCLNVGVYAADARAQDLPLLGGENAIHDWWFVLIDRDLLAYDQAIGRAFHAAGFFLFATSVALGIAFANEGERARGPETGDGTD